jgi:hypothetical protein
MNCRLCVAPMLAAVLAHTDLCADCRDGLAHLGLDDHGELADPLTHYRGDHLAVLRRLLRSPAQFHSTT